MGIMVAIVKFLKAIVGSVSSVVIGKGNLAAQASDQAKVQQTSVDTGGGSITTMNQPGVTLDANALFKEALEQGRLAEQLRLENLQLREENERLQEVAIARAESAARDEKDETAAHAMEQIRKTGNTTLLLEFLLERRRAIDAQAKRDCLEINREISVIAFMRDEIATAEEAVNQILKVAPDNLDALNRKGLIHRGHGDLEKARQSHQRALDLATAQNDRGAQAHAYDGLSGVHMFRRELDEAERMSRKSLALEEALGRKGGVASDYGNLGIFYAMRDDLATARKYWINARDLYKQIPGASSAAEMVQKWLAELDAKE